MKPPNKIFLQLETYPTSWCEDKQYDTDVCYVREKSALTREQAEQWLKENRNIDGLQMKWYVDLLMKFQEVLRDE